MRVPYFIIQFKFLFYRLTHFCLFELQTMLSDCKHKANTNLQSYYSLGAPTAIICHIELFTCDFKNMEFVTGMRAWHNIVRKC